MYKNKKFNANDSDDFELEKKKINDQLTNQMYLYSYFHNMFRKPSCVEEKQLIKLLKKEIENLKNQLKKQYVPVPISSVPISSVPYGLAGSAGPGSAGSGSGISGSAGSGSGISGSCLKSFASVSTSTDKSSIPIILAKSISEADMKLLQNFFETCYDNKINQINYLKYKQFIIDNKLDENCFIQTLYSILKLKRLLDPEIVAEIMKTPGGFSQDVNDEPDKMYGIELFRILRQTLKKFKISNETLKMYLDELGFKCRLTDLTELLKEYDVCNDNELKLELTKIGILNSSGLKTKPDIEESESDQIFANIGSLYTSKKIYIDCLQSLYNILIRPSDMITLKPGDNFDYFTYIFTREVTNHDVSWGTIMQSKTILNQVTKVFTVDEYKEFVKKHITFEKTESLSVDSTAKKSPESRAIDTNIELIRIFKQYGIFINYEYINNNTNDSTYKIEISQSVIDKANQALAKKIAKDNESKLRIEKNRNLFNFKLVPGESFDWSKIKKQTANQCDQLLIKDFFIKLAKAPTLADLEELLNILKKSPAKLVKSMNVLIKCLEQMNIIVLYDDKDPSTFVVYAKKSVYPQDTTSSISKTSTGKKSTDPIEIISDIFTSDISKATEAFDPINIDEMFNFDFSF
jgi:hypothetical protein